MQILKFVAPNKISNKLKENVLKSQATHSQTVVLFEYLILILLLAVGGVLRLWDMSNIPFTHDELSALSRLRFNNFTDLIQYGVLPDGHPAGVQVFLYYWTSLVGTSEIMVKIPFIFSGILSIWLTYLIGKLWFDGTTGLLAAAYVSSLQFFVMYSQIARPYISGLFITLLMVYMWSLYFYRGKKLKHLLLYIVFGAMAAYNHHFSLLFAAIVGVSGLFFVKKKELLIYSLSGVAIFILYIPHLSIFFSQLGYGGIGGWLSKPTPNFFIKFIDWTFHYSQVVWASLFGTILYLVLTNGSFAVAKNGKQKRLMLLAWFLLPIIIGYAYSVLRNPVIQYSMLIFSTPYLFMLLFSYHKKISIKQVALLVVLLLFVNVSTLIYGRDYYIVFSKQPYEQSVKAALAVNDTNNVFLIDGGIAYFNEYYFNKFNKSIPYYSNTNSDLALTEFDSIVKNVKESNIVVSSLSGEQIQIVQSYFPYQIDFDCGFTYELYTFSKKIPENKDVIERQLIAHTNFKDEVGNWKDVDSMIEYDSLSNEYYCSIPAKHEWGPSVKFSFQDIAKKGLGIIDVELEVMMPDTISKYLIASTITKGDELLSWDALDFQIYSPVKGKWKKIYYTVNVQHLLKSRMDVDGLELKINIWNLSKNKLRVNYINIYRKPGNPIKYALYNEIYR